MSSLPRSPCPSKQDNDGEPAIAVELIDPVLLEDFVNASSSSLKGDNKKEKPKASSSSKSFFVGDDSVLKHSTLDLSGSNSDDADKGSAESEEGPSTVPTSILVGVIAFSVLYTIFFSGAIFGWGPMQLLLEEDEAFESQCGEDEELPCDKQSFILVQIQLIATLTAVFSPFLGIFTDCYGALALMYLLSFFGVSSIVLTMLASSTGAHELYYISFSLTGLTFIASTQMIVQTGLCMPGKAQQRVISTLNALLDAGSIIYLGLHEIAEATGANLVQIMGGYLCFAVFCFTGAIGFWTMLIRFTERRIDADSTESVSGGDPEETHANLLGAGSKDTTKPIVGNSNTNDGNKDDGIAKIANERSNIEDEQHSGYIIIAQRSPEKQLTSNLYIFMLVFFSVHLTRNNWVMATNRDFLASLGDDEEGNKYTQLFTGVSAASLIGVPLLDVLMTKYGFHVAFQAVNLLGVIHGIIQVSTDNLNVQVLGFVVFSFYRCFTFSATFSFMPTFLSGNNVGRGCGGLSFVSAIFSLVNMGLAKWTIDGLRRDFLVTNLLMLLVVVPMLYLTWLIGQCIQKEKKAEKFVSAFDLDKSHHTSVSLSRTCKIVSEPHVELASTNLRVVNLPSKSSQAENPELGSSGFFLKNVGSMDEVVDC